MKELKTNSQWLSEPSPLDAIFAESKPFIDALHAVPNLLFTGGGNEEFARKIASGEPDTVTVPDRLKQEVSRFIRIIHGPHNADYVWHIEPASIRKPWRVPEDHVLYLIARTMNAALPEVEAKLWLPEGGWELRTITFKALDLNNHWGFDVSLVPAINAKLFEVLNKVV